ncbi:hypothetical protein [Citricoccus nitrophenolicus]|uniref:hypothetical protein n=1 Tax=Citricoccus nitrophenolicus TaxID=863575 RepID=UPI0031E8D29C
MALAGVPHLVYASSIGAYGKGSKTVSVDESHPTTGKLREATGWTETVSSQQALRALLDGFNGAEGLGNAGHRSSSPLE